MDRSAPKQRINELLGKYKYPVLVLLVGLGLMLLPGRSEPAPEQRITEAEPVRDLGIGRAHV